MKTMLNPAMAVANVSGSEAFSLEFLPKIETISTDYAFGFTGMRVAGFAAMLAMTALVAIL